MRVMIAREEVESEQIARELVYTAKELLGYSETEVWKERLRDNEEDIKIYTKLLKEQGKTSDNKWLQDHLRRLQKHNETLKKVIKETGSDMPKAASERVAAPVGREVLKGIQKTHRFIDGAEEAIQETAEDYTDDRDVLMAYMKVSQDLKNLRKSVQNLGNSMRGLG